MCYDSSRSCQTSLSGQGLNHAATPSLKAMSREEQERKPLKVLFKEDDFTVEDEEEARELYSTGYYGEYVSGKLKLSPAEVLHLLERGRIRVYDDSGKELEFDEVAKRLMKKNPQTWLKYLVYSDLRRRGYVVKEGFSDRVEFRVYRRGAEVGSEGAKYLVYGVIEGEPLDLNNIYNMTKTARALRKEPVLAIVNRQGEVCYYEVALVSL